MISRQSRMRVVRLLLGALLFAQAALAVAACDWLSVAPAQALGVRTGEPSCHEEPAKNSNLCLAHCLNGDQKLDVPQAALPAWVPAVIVVAVPDLSRPSNAFTRRPLHRPGAPPPRILFQSFLI